MSGIIQGLLASYRSLVFPTNNLLGYYKLNSDANTSIGVANGTETSISYVSGKISNAASFNGSTSRITGCQTPNTGAGSFTINAWVQYNSLSNIQTIYTYGTNGTNQNVFFYKDTDNKIVCNFYGGGGSATSTTTVGTATWYMCTSTYDGTNIRVYINGTLESTGANITGSVVSGYCYIGLGWDGSSWVQNGLIDELGVWNRALTLGEITTLYNSGSGITY